MNNKLKSLRLLIDEIDKELLTILHKRIRLVRKIGELKKTKKLSALDPKRWLEVLKTRIEWGKQLDISEKLIKKIYTAIHEDALYIEREA